MDFTQTFEQQALVESLAAFVEKELYPHEDLVEELRHVPADLAIEIKKKAHDAGFIATLEAHLQTIFRLFSSAG